MIWPHPARPLTAGIRIFIHDLPALPGRLPGVPNRLQLALIAQGIHRLSEPPMPKGRKSVVLCEPLKRLPFLRRAVVVNIFDRRRFNDEESAVDPSHLIVRVFMEASYNFGFADIEDAEPSKRRHRRHRRQASLRDMKIHQRANIDIGNTVAMGQTECLVAEIRRNPLDPSSEPNRKRKLSDFSPL